MPAEAVDLPKLINKVLPSVVVIVTYKNGEALKQGSGFFVTNNGDILTNAHVLKDGDNFLVLTNKSKSYVAKLKAMAADGQDIALIQIADTSYSPLKISSGTVLPGTRVIAIGSPSGQRNTISDGVTSGVRVMGGVPFLQVSAPISHGSSGGPILNEAGEVIAMTTWALSEGNDLNFGVPNKQLSAFVAKSKSLPPIKLHGQQKTQRGSAPKTTVAPVLQKERYVFMTAHNEAVDGYTDSYLDAYSVYHDQDITTFVLLSHFGQQVANALKKNGETPVYLLTVVQIDGMSKNSRIIYSGAYDSNSHLMIEDKKATLWQKIKNGTSIELYMNYIISNNL